MAVFKFELAKLGAISLALFGAATLPQRASAQEFAPDKTALYVQRVCLTENPKRFLRRAKYIEDLNALVDEKWDVVQDGKNASYVSPDKGLKFEVSEGMIDAACTATISNDIINAGYDATAQVQTTINALLETEIAPEQDGDSVTWNWKGKGAYQMQSYSARVISGDSTIIEWKTE